MGEKREVRVSVCGDEADREGVRYALELAGCRCNPVLESGPFDAGKLGPRTRGV